MSIKSTLIRCLILLFLVMIMPTASFADSIISGCVGKSGTLRMVSSSTQCKPFETFISWNNINVVHGTVNPDGTWTGTGFSVWHPQTGEYNIMFDHAFSSPPDCIARAHAISSVIDCFISGGSLDGSYASAICTVIQFGVDPDTLNYEINSTNSFEPFDTTFSFICVQ